MHTHANARTHTRKWKIKSVAVTQATVTFIQPSWGLSLSLSHTQTHTASHLCLSEIGPFLPLKHHSGTGQEEVL